MKKVKRKSRGIVSALAILLFVSCIPHTAKAEEWDVVRGETDYSVSLDKSRNVFICNKGSIGNEVGTEIYMTYTVESMQIQKIHGDGVIGTNQPKARFPYEDSQDGVGGGVLYQSSSNKLLSEGRTYFVKFTITEDGYTYRAGWSQDEDSGYIKLGTTVGKAKSDAQYFGVWLAHEDMTGKLIRVRIYDKQGKDLGVQVTAGRNASVEREQTFNKNEKIDHKYTIELNSVYNVALSNQQVPTKSKVYMEYKVKSSQSKVFQVGGILSDKPKEVYPYLDGGHLIYESFAEPKPDLAHNGPLLVEGAEYLIIFEKKLDYLDVIVQKEHNGVKSMISLGNTYGEYNSELQYFSLWFAGGEKMLMNAVLEDFKCYDSAGNNLGVQCNRGNVTITHYGELEDYSGCEAVYYSKEDKSLYALYADKSMKYTMDGKTQQGTYKVKDGTMTVSLDGQEREYEYKYLYIKDDTGKRYDRLRTYKVKFETGAGTEIETQIVSANNGYQATKPEQPTLKDNEFLGWYKADGTEYQFDELVTRSITLYAKWSNVEYAFGEKEAIVQPYVYIGIGAIILSVSVVAGVLIMKKGKNYGEHKKNTQKNE